MKRRRTMRIGAMCVCVLAILTGSSFAYYSSNGGGNASAAVTSLAAPSISSATAATGGTVELKWTAVTAPNSGTVKYYVTRNGGLPAESCPDVNEPETVLTCTDNGLNPGTYEYKVIAVWSGWTKASVVKTATVTVGPVAKFTIAGSTSTPSTGAGPYTTITAVDSAGKTVTTFTGSHNLVFSGASASAEGKVPTVANASGTAIPFGEATALTFSGGIASGGSLKNGYVQIYKPGEATITATEGSLTTPTGLTVNVVPTATKFVLSAATPTPTAGVLDALTIKAYDNYGNLSTNYAGTKTLTFSGPAASPNGTAATVENASGSQIAIGSATTITFKEGVAAASEAGTGAKLSVYKSGSAALTVKEGTTITSSNSLALTVAAGSAASLTLTGTTSFVTTSGSALTVTAKDAWGNVATSYTGEKKITFAASGTASETSPGGTVPGVVNNAGTAVPFGTQTAITFTSGAAASASAKNGYLRLYKVGTASITASDGTFTSPAVTFTATIGTAKRFAITGLTSSAGTISNPCFFSCTVSGLGNSGTITAYYTATDEYGNAISNIGAGKTVTVAAGGTTGSSVTPTSLTFAETGTATTTANFTFTAPSGTGAFTNTVTASATGYTSTVITATK